MKGRNVLRLRKKVKYASRYKIFWEKSVKKLILIWILCISLLMSSCNVSGFINGFNSNSAYKNLSGSQVIEKENFVLLLISCVTNLSEIKNVYSEISRFQLDGMSFSAFDEYIQALNDMVKGPVGHYRLLSGEEREKVLQPIRTRAKDQEDIISRTIPVELHMKNSDEVHYLFIQENENGSVYLSEEWVSACTSIYRYAILYFRALDVQNPNQAAVKSLLENAVMPETDGEISSLVIDYKARGLVEYYQRQVRERFETYQIDSFDLSQLTYVQPRFLDEMTGEYTPRSVNFIRRTPQLISVKDTVTSPLDSRDFELYKNGQRLYIAIGEWIDLASLDQLIGEEPLIISTEMESTEDVGTKTIVVSYKSLTITLRAMTDEDGELLRTRISRIRLRGDDSEFSLGSGIKNGMAVDSILRLYPFADIENYVLYASRDETNYQMIFSIDPTNGGYVTEVNLEASPQEM